MESPLKIIDQSNGDAPLEPASEPRPERRRPAARKARLRRRTPLEAGPRFGPGRVAQPRHRNPTWLVAGVLLVVLSALGGVLLFVSNDDRVEVLVTAADVQPGVRLQRTDLRIARVAVDGGIATVAPAAANDVIGRKAVGRVPAGTMLSPGMFADELPLDGDEVVFGAALDPGEAPLSGLQVGAQVELVAMQLGAPGGPPAELPLDATGGSDEEDSSTASTAGDTNEPDTVSATPIGIGTVWAVEQIATGQLWVSVRVEREVGLDASLASALDALRIVLIGSGS
ncbi:MAG: SAF domain-containing protein [Ilumatobacteraceae bacterium]